MNAKLEIIAFTVDCCEKIQAAGAHRIELCANPLEGGTTPSAGMIREARRRCQIDLFPIIRPRGGDFLYTDAEYETMKQDIRYCRSHSCDGVVLGLLLADGRVDYHRTARLVELAYPMEVTFHRAFDRSRDPFEALETIEKTGCTRLLTSGQRATASEGAALLSALIQAADDGLRIMPGSGIRSDNLAALMQEVAATEWHSSARKTIPGNMQYASPDMPEAGPITVVDEAEVTRLVQLMHAGS